MEPSEASAPTWENSERAGLDAAMLDAQSATILVVEDDPRIGRMLCATLEAEGYTAALAATGEDGLEYALRESPHLLILDIMLPGIDGFAVVQQLRRHAKTAHIPVVMLSARHDTQDVVRAFDSEVDDYLTKPFNIDELIARIRTQLRHVRESSLSPLTGLPSGLRVERAIEQQLASDTPWAMLYLDLDNFKAYNDVYGFPRGNDLIRLLGRVIVEATRETGDVNDFVGHIGGDDFVVITTPGTVDVLCARLIEQWDQESASAYSEEDLARGALVAHDRQGHLQTFPLVGVSIGVVSTVGQRVTTMEEFSSLAAEVKRKAKSIRGSAYYLDQRANG